MFKLPRLENLVVFLLVLVVLETLAMVCPVLTWRATFWACWVAVLALASLEAAKLVGEWWVKGKQLWRGPSSTSGDSGVFACVTRDDLNGERVVSFHVPLSGVHYVSGVVPDMSEETIDSIARVNPDSLDDGNGLDDDIEDETPDDDDDNEALPVGAILPMVPSGGGAKAVDAIYDDPDGFGGDEYDEYDHG